MLNRPFEVKAYQVTKLKRSSSAATNSSVASSSKTSRHKRDIKSLDAGDVQETWPEILTSFKQDKFYKSAAYKPEDESDLDDDGEDSSRKIKRRKVSDFQEEEVLKFTLQKIGYDTLECLNDLASELSVHQTYLIFIIHISIFFGKRNDEKSCQNFRT